MNEPPGRRSLSARPGPLPVRPQVPIGPFSCQISLDIFAQLLFSPIKTLLPPSGERGGACGAPQSPDQSSVAVTSASRAQPITARLQQRGEDSLVGARKTPELKLPPSCTRPCNMTRDISFHVPRGPEGARAWSESAGGSSRGRAGFRGVGGFIRCLLEPETVQVQGLLADPGPGERPVQT